MNQILITELGVCKEIVRIIGEYNLPRRVQVTDLYNFLVYQFNTVIKDRGMRTSKHLKLRWVKIINEDYIYYKSIISQMQ